MATKKTKKIKLKFVCPHCGEEDCLDEVQRINELHVPIIGATKDSDGHIDLEGGDVDLSDAEVIDAYYMCSACLEHISDPDSCFVPDK